MAPGNDERRQLDGYPECALSAAPETLWPVLERFIPPPDTLFSVSSAAAMVRFPGTPQETEATARRLCEAAHTLRSRRDPAG